MAEEIETTKLNPNLFDKSINQYTFYFRETTLPRHWKIKFNKPMNSKQIAFIIEKCLGDFGHVNNIDQISPEKGIGTLSFGFTLLLDFKENNNLIKLNSENEFSVILEKENIDFIWIKIDINLFSDYVRNKYSGEIKNFSTFAYKNRENLEKFLRNCEKELNGLITEIFPQKNDYQPHWSDTTRKANDWAAEEMWKYGFLPMTHLKEEYEKQNKKKGFLGWLRK